MNQIAKINEFEKSLKETKDKVVNIKNLVEERLDKDKKEEINNKVNSIISRFDSRCKEYEELKSVEDKDNFITNSTTAIHLEDAFDTLKKIESLLTTNESNSFNTEVEEA